MTDSALSPLQEVSRRLKEARVKKGWSIENVMQRTRITQRHILAIEAGDLSSMPADVYTRGFIRSYAKAVDVEEGPLMQLLNEAGIVSATESGGRHVNVVERKGISPSARIWVAAASVLLGGALIGFGIRGIFKLLSGSGQQEIPPSPFAAAKPVEKASRPKAPEAQRVEIMEKTAKPGKEALQVVAISVTALEECWFQVQADEDSPQEITLMPGEQGNWGAESRLRLLVGNAGGIKIHSSLGPVNLPQKKGRVVHLLFTRRGEERLEVPVLPPMTSSQPGATSVIPAVPVASAPSISGTLSTVSSPGSTAL